LRDQIIVIEGYYDSMSVVPSLAPGAESACGIATMLELARIFKTMFCAIERRPKTLRKSQRFQLNRLD